MPYSESTAARLRNLLSSTNVEEQKMFGGLGFLLRGNMSVGLWKEFLILRIDPDTYHTYLAQPHIKPFDVTGRPMAGWLMVAPEGYATDADLQKWISISLHYVNALPEKSAAMMKKMKSKMARKPAESPEPRRPKKPSARKRK